MKTLAIDTSNQTLAVAVVDGQEVLGQSQTMAIKNHSTALMPAIDGLMQAVGMAPKELEQIVVAKGPGSYTGLRIGVTTAKTLAQTLNIPLIGVSSLKAVAANCVGVSQVTLETRIKDQHISLPELLTQLKAADGQEVLFVGADTIKFKDMIEVELPIAHINQVSLWNYPNGVVLAAIAKEEAPVASIHDFVPDYLKLVEAEEKWLASHEPGVDAYVEKI